MIVLKGRRNGGDLIALSPDGRTLAVRCESGLQIWHGLSVGAKPELIRGITIGWLQFTTDSRRLLLDGHTSAMLDLETKVLTPIPSTGAGYRFVSLSPDGKHAITTNSPGRREQRISQIDYWTTDRIGVGRPIWSVPLDGDGSLRARFLSASRFALRELPESPPGRPANRLAIRSTANGAVLDQSPNGEWYPDWDAVSPDGQWIAGAKERRIVIWSTGNLSIPAAGWDNDNRRSFTDIEFHPSSRYLAATSNDKSVKLYDTTNWELAKTFTWDIGRMRSIAFSPDGNFAAAGSDTGKVVVWDVDV